MITRRIEPAVERDEALPTRAVMTMPPDWVAGAFIEAVDRVKAAAALEPETARQIAIPVAEALMWVDVLQQTSRDVGRGRDMAKKIARDPLVKALIFVRGRVHHHWAPVSYRDAVRGEWVWLQAANLPVPPDQRFANPAGEHLYKAHLEGRSVIETLDEAAQRFKPLT